MEITGNDDHTVGNIDACVSVRPGDTVEFDVVLGSIPAGRNLTGFQYFMGFDDTSLTFTAQDHTTAGVNIIARHPDSCTGYPGCDLGCYDSSEDVPEPPDMGNPSPGVHEVFVVDSTKDGIPDGNTPMPLAGLVGSDTDPYGNAGGVLGRYRLTVGVAAPPRLYGIGLNDSVCYIIRLLDATPLWEGGPTPIWDLPGNGVDDDGDGAIDEDLMLDASAGYGLVAVGQPCPGRPDSDGDGLDDECDDDDDDDGFDDSVEAHVSTDPLDACPDDPNDDAWPPDINADTVVDIFDADTFVAAFPSAEASPNYSQRLDLAYGDGVIDIFDGLTFLNHFPGSCTNP